MPALSEDGAELKIRASASYDGDRLHLIRVPGGIGGKCRSHTASGVVCISKFEK